MFRKLLSKKDAFENQISDQSVQWLIRNVSSVRTDIFNLVEPGTQIAMADAMRVPSLLAEFAQDPKLGIIHGKGKGHAFFRIEFLKQIVEDRNVEITDYSSLVKAFRDRGFNVKRVEYVEFEQV